MRGRAQVLEIGCLQEEDPLLPFCCNRRKEDG
jgi:hypothetical protein